MILIYKEKVTKKNMIRIIEKIEQFLERKKR